jgi:hypothetical protein
MTAPARTFRDLVVWQKAHEFVLGVYNYTSGFPKHELYGLTSQMRRADLGYGLTEELSTRIEEVSRLINAYSRAILTSDS